MKKLYLALINILFVTAIQAQNPADIDPTFLIGKSFSESGSINAMTVQADGKIIAGGSFNSYDQINTNSVVRLNADGTIDPTFNAGTAFVGNATSVAVQSDGKILVGGESNTFNGITSSNIIRLNTNGTKDNSFNTGTGPDSYVYSIAIQQDGKIILGGYFSSYNGTPAIGIVRLNTDGTVDKTFNPATGAYAFIQVVTIQPDGKILVGETGSIYRLNSDGSKDVSFTANTGVSLTSAILLQSDGKIVVGDFGSVFRLNSDGTKDITFDSVSGFDSAVNALKIQSDGKIVVGGSFTAYDGVTSNRAIRLNPTGTVDHTFNFGPEKTDGPDIFDGINSVFILSNGKILFGGSTTFYDKKTISGVVLVASDGVKDNSFNVKNAAYERYSSTANSVLEQPDGKIIAVGNFNYYFGRLSSGIVRLNTNGTIDNSFNTGSGLNNGNGYISSVAVQSNGKILVAGNFSSFNAITVGNIIRLNSDGSIDNAFNIGSTGANTTISSIAVQSDGKILIAGQFNSYNGTFCGNLIRLNSDGSLDNSFNIMAVNSTGNGLNAMALQTDGKILYGGIYFGRLNLDGTTDTTFHTGSGFVIMTGMGGHQPTIKSILIQGDGKIIVSGIFNNYNGTTANGIIRVNSDATVDTTFNLAANSSINGIGIQANGKILLGIITDPNNKTTDILRLNPDGHLDTSYTSNSFDNSISGLMVQKDGKIIAIGSFTKYSTTTCLGIVRLMGDPILSDESFTKVEFSLYPNPAINEINLSVPDGLSIDNITITDFSGKAVLRLRNTTEINVEELAVGMYILNVYSGGEKWAGKFIKE